MSNAKVRPPLTPSDCTHLGRGLDGLEVLRWESQSREGKRHYTYGTLDAAKECSCEWRRNNPAAACKHMRCFVDALRHHLGEPPPADPGGAVGEPPELAGLGECEDAARENLRYHLRQRLDRAVAEDGHRWIQSRTAAGVRLTCVACKAVRGWASEGAAAAWLEGGGVCGCGGPTPPAQGAARKPIAEHLSLLYGDS